MGYGRAARATRRRSPCPCGAATQTAACARIASLVRAPLLRATSGRGSVVIRVVRRRDSCGAVRQRRPMVVCGWAAPRASWRRLPPQQRPPQRAAVSHPWDLPAGSARFTTGFARLRFVDREGTALQFFALEPSNGGLRRAVVGHFHEAKAFGPASRAINNDTDLVHGPILLKERAKVMISGAKRKVAYIDIHGDSL